MADAKILNLIYESIDDISDQITTKVAKKPEEVLFGQGGKLDSLGLVNLIVAVESMVEDELDVTITLADEKAMSMKNSPFRTIQTLADYINLLIERE
ncbi:MAG: acyl carrier protein [Candidatus Kapabacteria bacterium]|jgi:D-alanine--poly(phosphoribitol) ligase subunit 2|nr:acyl carrier protein [Candidatus Kapabacteria bacterium]